MAIVFDKDQASKSIVEWFIRRHQSNNLYSVFIGLKDLTYNTNYYRPLARPLIFFDIVRTKKSKIWYGKKLVNF